MALSARCHWLLGAIAACLAEAGVQGQEPPADSTSKQQIEAALALTKEAAGKYEFSVGEGGRSQVKLLPEPVLRWSNPTVGEIHGNVFLWTAAGRPVAVGSLFKWFSPHKHTSHEFQSLTEQRLAARYEGREVWVVKEPGVSFVPLSRVEAPAESSTRRLAQMRQLARPFSSKLTTREGDDQELRLLPQPIYRYSSEKEGVIDGGLFAFVQGTDPEVLLLVEARDDKERRWLAAGARMHNVALSLKFDDREIWTVPQLEWKTAFDHSQPYTLFDTPGK